MPIIVDEQFAILQLCSHAGGVLVLLLNLLLNIYACESVILPSEVLKMFRNFIVKQSALGILRIHYLCNHLKII